MTSLHACAAMPELWQMAIGLVIVVIALYEMADCSFGYIALVVVMGFAMPAFTHDYVYMGVAIMFSVVVIRIMRWFLARSKS
ncbi:MAG: hypothetical protein EKK48_19125 [Candidatus Melainabacteria bacterium]|nr:MAG: hypothetical protein EKK48_19125 [Candidatus Melainabacteria bacterium]